MTRIGGPAKRKREEQTTGKERGDIGQIAGWPIKTGEP